MSPSAKSNLPAPTLAVAVVALMVGLYGIDKFLAAQEQAELAQEAHNHYAAGRAQLHAGKTKEAVVNFARAHTLERSNREYVLALATAQLADHQPASARDTLGEVLDEDSNDGRANLLMARVLVAEERFKDADSYYHRAIYGEWPADEHDQPQKVRLELADMLAQHSNSQELLSELLLLQTATHQDLATEKQVAQLFLQAGSAQRAAEAYRHLIRENPDDIDSHLGLVQAETLAGDYRAAENALMAALRKRPYDDRIQAQLRLVVRLASLDPTSRRLSTAEKYRRSEEIFQLASAEVDACSPVGQNGGTDKIDGPVTNEKAEARLDEAENLWKHRADFCKQPPVPGDPLPLLMKKLSQ